MRLVFIHGWGFDASFWDALSGALPDIPQTRVGLGFFNDCTNIPTVNDNDILVGHSLGFMWGMAHSAKWRGWIAINGFARFTDNTEHKACVPSSALRALRHSLAKNTEQTLQRFYKNIGAEQTIATPNAAHLAAGLEILQNGDVTATLKNSKASGLVLTSHNDPLVPAAVSEFLAAQNKNTKIMRQDQGGHLLPVTHAQWCADAIKYFLA